MILFGWTRISSERGRLCENPISLDLPSLTTSVLFLTQAASRPLSLSCSPSVIRFSCYSWYFITGLLIAVGGWERGCVEAWAANVLQTHLSLPPVYICLWYGGLDVMTKTLSAKFIFPLSWPHKCSITYKGPHQESTCQERALLRPG